MIYMWHGVCHADFCGEHSKPSLYNLPRSHMVEELRSTFPNRKVLVVLHIGRVRNLQVRSAGVWW